MTSEWHFFLPPLHSHLLALKLAFSDEESFVTPMPFVLLFPHLGGLNTLSLCEIRSHRHIFFKAVFSLTWICVPQRPCLVAISVMNEMSRLFIARHTVAVDSQFMIIVSWHRSEEDEDREHVSLCVNKHIFMSMMKISLVFHLFLKRNMNKSCLQWC